MKTVRFAIIVVVLFMIPVMFALPLSAQDRELDDCNITWHTQSTNAGQSMPCGGGDIGLNVWVEKGDILFYIARSGAFDENNTLLKAGRIRLRLTPNPFKGSTFTQRLVLEDGSVYITGKDGNLSARVHLWVDVHHPVIHLQVKASRAIRAEADFESWRYTDHIVRGKENEENSYKFAPQGTVTVHRDQIGFTGDDLVFYHRNKDTTIFDVTVKQQGLQGVKSRLFDPLKDLTCGGIMTGSHLSPAGTYRGSYLHTPFEGWRLKSKKKARDFDITLLLHTARTASAGEWSRGLKDSIREAVHRSHDNWEKTLQWWGRFWDRSFIYIDPGQKKENAPFWQAGRNYQLFRYMLGCNAYGHYPTKFNGGLFTYDPVCVDNTFPFTPDFRRWGGGTFTAQNQRLVYDPMLAAGDFDMMASAFDFYLRLLKTAELRSKVYWGHGGACFTEQLEDFGLPNASEYGWKRPAYFDKGMQYNAWLEYDWDTVLEFCQMMLQVGRYTGKDISRYIPFIECCLTFFNEHYQYLARRRGRKTFDAQGHLVLYPGSACETYKMTYNSTTTIAALQTVLKELLVLPASYLDTTARQKYDTLLTRIPPISFRYFKGHRTIAPAALWQRINNVEAPQLYPVFPWHIYGIGRPGLDIALNTWNYDTTVLKNRSYIGWKQDNIFAACLGLTKEATRLTMDKLKNASRRFPAFWGPGFDWVPDHNWGGSGMIGLQKMLLQCNGKKIYLFPAWPVNRDVHFKLHCPYQTTVEATLSGGKIRSLIVTPASRKKDVVIMAR
ncbi:MAG TPA: DUF5703 domain-containing protein, partial [Chitinophagaceae bacterium]|nr:DUF5703 domain-containing protein [Chitinophagaceae bacterium]